MGNIHDELDYQDAFNKLLATSQRFQMVSEELKQADAHLCNIIVRDCQAVRQ